jgi:hypothetical protein
MPLGDGNVKRPGVGVAVGLALLTVQAGFSPGCHISSKAAPPESRRNKTPGGEEVSLPGCEILCNVQMGINVFLVLCWHSRLEITCGNMAD